MEPLIHLKEKFDIGDRSHELAQRTSPAPRESVDSYYQRYCAELQRIANIATMQNKGVEVSIEEIFDPYYLAYNFLKGTDPVLTRIGEKIFADPEKRSKYQMPFSFNDFRLDKMVQLIHLAERENRSLNDEASIFKLALNTPSKKGDKPQSPSQASQRKMPRSHPRQYRSREWVPSRAPHFRYYPIRDSSTGQRQPLHLRKRWRRGVLMAYAWDAVMHLILLITVLEPGTMANHGRATTNPWT